MMGSPVYICVREKNKIYSCIVNPRGEWHDGFQNDMISKLVGSKLMWTLKVEIY